ncbi:MAG TPA: hypothetical protein VMX74_03230, partial [Pirellulales bacterium]|nr:hypothetical protein [Pirellulales bacterium]
MPPIANGMLMIANGMLMIANGMLMIAVGLTCGGFGVWGVMGAWSFRVRTFDVMQDVFKRQLGGFFAPP